MTVGILNYFQVGIALKPKTPVETVIEYVENADMVLIMTVEPGEAGAILKLLDQTRFLELAHQGSVARSS
jgi:pentose-5-phosphate-3-epimerase